MVVEPDDEQVEVPLGPRHRSELLLVPVEHRLTRQREPIVVPPGRLTPEGRPHVVVEPDDEQVEVPLGPRHRSELLLVPVEHRLTRQRNQSLFQR